jgi:hypothetical protein
VCSCCSVRPAPVKEDGRSDGRAAAREKKIVKIDCGEDNSTVDFEKSLIFFTNNLDGRENAQGNALRHRISNGDARITGRTPDQD